MIRLLIATVIFAALLMACSGDDKPGAPSEQDTSLVEPMRGTIDRAQDVEQQMHERRDELDKRLQELEGR